MIKQFAIKHKRLLVDIGVIFALLFFSSLMFVLVKPHLDDTNVGYIPQIIGGVGVFFCLAFLAFLIYKKRINQWNLIFILFMIGYCIRLAYILYNTLYQRQYDTVDRGIHSGHEDYAWTIYTTGGLPTTNGYQFYHPPLNAFIQSCFMYAFRPMILLGNAICGREFFILSDMDSMFSCCMVLSLTIVNITIIVGIRTIQYFKLNKILSILCISAIIFFPRFIPFSGQLNNDVLGTMFAFFAIYFTIRWWFNMSFVNICGIAVSIGLGIMTKFNDVVVCLFILVIFIVAFVKSVKNKCTINWKRMLTQFAIFLVVCFPLALWFQFYALVRFNQPFGYVLEMNDPTLYTGNYSVFDRFFNIFNREDLFTEYYARSRGDKNIYIYFVKSSLFGEFAFTRGTVFALIGVTCFYIFPIFTVVLFTIYFIKTKKENLFEKVIISTIFLSNALAMVYFYWKLPYGCTMDSRYIIPIFIGLIPMAFFSCKYFSKFPKLKYISYTNIALLMVVLASSNIFYLVNK